MPNFLPALPDLHSVSPPATPVLQLCDSLKGYNSNEYFLYWFVFVFVSAWCVCVSVCTKENTMVEEPQRNE